jgi:hypothetical protein
LLASIASGLLRTTKSIRPPWCSASKTFRVYPYLFAELLRRGYSELMKIAGRSHLRAMRQMEQVAARFQKTEAPLIREAATPKWTL